MGQYISSYFMPWPSITHIVFDLDGVLIDSEVQYSKAMQDCVGEYGKKFTLEQKLKIMGNKKSDAIRKLLEFNDLLEKVSVDEMMAIYNRHLGDVLLDCPILPGAERLINHLHEHKIPMAICTGSDAEEFEQKTRKNLQHWLKIIPVRVLVGSDPEVKNGKPAPDPYLVTFKRLENKPESIASCLVFEDSVNGARSALDAGMQCILIPQKQFLCEETEKSIGELRPRLTAVLNSMEEFKPELYGLPAFNQT